MKILKVIGIIIGCIVGIPTALCLVSLFVVAMPVAFVSGVAVIVAIYVLMLAFLFLIPEYILHLCGVLYGDLITWSIISGIFCHWIVLPIFLISAVIVLIGNKFS